MIPTITTVVELDAYIAQLKAKKEVQELELKASLKETVEALKPVNLIKTAWNQVTTSPELKDNIVDNGIGLAAGFVSKKILIGNTHNPIKRLLGSLAQYGISNAVANHPDAIKNVGTTLFKMIFKKRNQKKTGEQSIMN